MTVADREGKYFAQTTRTGKITRNSAK